VNDRGQPEYLAVSSLREKDITSVPELVGHRLEIFGFAWIEPMHIKLVSFWRVLDLSVWLRLFK
jgi:hypothetical protein